MSRILGILGTTLLLLTEAAPCDAAISFPGPYAAAVMDGLGGLLDPPRPWLPSQPPADGLVSSGFGVRRSPFTGRRVRHEGLDFAVSRGTPVHATADGVVAYAGWIHGFGRVVEIDHGHGLVTRYAHNSRLLVKAGEHVTRGQPIARAGSTGRSTGPHVHYEVWVDGRPVDPSGFLMAGSASLAFGSGGMGGDAKEAGAGPSLGPPPSRH